MRKIFIFTLFLAFSFLCLTYLVFDLKKEETTPTTFLDAKETLIIAHRGYQKDHVENTLGAFQNAVEAGYQAIECDVRFTKDQIPVILHDASIKGVTGVNQLLKDLTFDELQAIPLLNAPEERIPLFQDYLEICKNSGATAIIEIKEEIYNEKQLDFIYQTIQASGISNYILISFELDALIYLRNKIEDVEMHYLGRKYSPRYLADCITYGFNPSLNYKSLTPAMVEEFHANGLKVGCWTVDDYLVAKDLIASKIDYLTTNVLLD